MMATGSVLSNVKHIILVLSGKGGVGKSTVATQLSLELATSGKKVGLLDIDLCGPSVAKMLDLQGRDIHQCSDGWLPVYTDSSQQLAVMSIAFLLSSRDDPIVWRGPKKNAMIKQFLSDVAWGELEYLIIDTPPGTSDEHITVVESLQTYSPDGAILVSTPQAVSLADVRRELSFCRRTRLPVLGLVENMSGFVCPHCSECTNVFSSGGGESFALESQISFLGRIPLDPNLAQCTEEGQSLAKVFPASPSNQAVRTVVDNLLAQLESRTSAEQKNT